ncbi:MAG: proteinral secretion pathway protein D [Comamonadaceae bacterium]|nr:MAG: proteinral secretion pathway protein D [Comamonadaceae bacterium]
MKPLPPMRLALSILLAALLLSGCAQQRIRDEATIKLREGNFEQAINGLQRGIDEYPESVTLRSGLVAARSEAVTRLVAQISQLRTQGQFDEADKIIQRGLALDPENSRFQKLQADMALARKQRSRQDEITTLIAADKKEQALRLVEEALRDSPHQSELIALQRRLEIESRLPSDNGRVRGLVDSRPISLDFRNSPLSAVLEAITRASGINFVLDRDVRQESRVTVNLRSIRVDDAIELVTKAYQLGSQTIDSKTVLIYPNTPDKQREHQEQVIRVFHLAYTDAKSTAAFLRSMLRIKEPFIDERTNMISIRETPDIVRLAERLVALHDIGEGEVMLDVEILEVKTSRLTELGINFPNSVTLTPLPAAGATGLTVNSLRTINADRTGVSVAGLLVNLRREVGDFNILANPRIRTKSKEKAHIMIGDKVPVITSTTNATGFVAETVTYLDVGLKLDVEPIVAANDDVSIKLALEVSSLAREVRTASGSVAYQIGSRNANTMLRLHDGETQLLAGLISNEDRSTSNRIPGLGDLPIAGRLFSSQKDDVQRTELVLAITPRILRNAARLDLAQAEMWVGTELSTRLRAPPSQRTASVQQSPAVRPQASGAAPEAKPLGSPNVSSVMSTEPARAIWRAPADVKVGEIFTLNLELASGAPLRGAPLEIAFEPQSVEVIDISEGAFFKQNDGITSFTQAVNTTTGRIGVGLLRSDTTGAMGRAPLLTLRLKAKKPGATQIHLTSFKPIPLGEPVLLGELPVINLNVQ